jgi:creatinine amidohydrolase
MMNKLPIGCLFVLLYTSAFAQPNEQPTTREMNLIGWLEFRKFVPAKIKTVLLPVGTLEPHGVLPNGSDNLAPEAMAHELAPRLNAMIAPALNYGVTGTLRAYPGAFAISEEAYRLFIRDIFAGLAGNGFKNIIILNGHGGPQTAILQEIAGHASGAHHVRTLVINWWSVASEVVFDVFDENGGHAGNNETAYVQHIVPEHVHPERYSPAMATPYPKPKTWSATPFPSSIGLYEPGQGYPTFDKAKAKEYYEKVNETIFKLIDEVIRKWDLARLYEE